MIPFVRISVKDVKKILAASIFCLWCAAVYASYISTALRYYDVRVAVNSLKERLKICR